jgi:hypothetical protein
VKTQTVQLPLTVTLNQDAVTLVAVNFGRIACFGGNQDGVARCDRRLLLRGGALDGRRWVGVVSVGKRMFCGEEPWSTAGVYLVTTEVEFDDDGKPANIAVPAFAAEETAGAAST